MYTNEELVFAVETGDLETVKFLIDEEEEYIDDYDKETNESLLRTAVEHKQYEIVKYFVEHERDRPWRSLYELNLTWALDDEFIFNLLLRQEEIDLEHKDEFNKTVLWNACKANKISIVKKLLAKGAEIEGDYDEKSSEVPLLFQAIEDDNMKLAMALIEGGADLEVEKNEYTPLYMTVRKYQYDFAWVLLEHGAKVRCFGRNSLIILCDDSIEKAHELAIAMICHQPSCLNKVGGHHFMEDTGDFDLEELECIEGENARPFTPLGAAVHCGNDKLVWILKLSGGEISEEERDYKREQQQNHMREDLHDFEEEGDETDEVQLSINAAFRIKQWSPDDHKWYPKEIKDAIKCLCLVAKRLNWNIDKPILHHIISFLPFGWYTFRLVQQIQPKQKSKKRSCYSPSECNQSNQSKKQHQTSVLDYFTRL